MKNKLLFKIWDSHSGGYEELYLLGYNAVYSVESQPTFRRNMSLSSGLKNIAKQETSMKQVASTRKMEAACSSETSVDFQLAIWHYIQEDRTLQTFFFVRNWPL
jgi:hypothetical protein